VKNQSINLFSRTGLTILASIVTPIFAVVIMSSYFPDTWSALIQPFKTAAIDTPRVSVSPASLVEVPTSESCKRNYVSVKLDTFQECLVEGLSYTQVANTLGYAGTLTSSSGSVEIWQWNGGTGKYLSAVFVSGKMTSKSQVGLE
jgi:hypothetical protein